MLKNFVGTALASLAFALWTPVLTAAETEFDDCEAHFIAYAGASTYQFSPSLPGDLGRARLFTVLSYQRAAALKNFGRAFWRVEIQGPGPDGPVVRRARGAGRIDEHGTVLGEFFWDGRTEAGALVEPGKYSYTFSARFVPDRLATRRALRQYEDTEGESGVEDAQVSTRDVIVDYTLSREASQSIRSVRALSSCQTQQNSPMESGFPYNFYYGSTHSHSNFSDGGQPTGSCSSGTSYGGGTFTPADVFAYARNTSGLDFWVVNEHNHLINDSVATNNAPVTEAKVRQRYQDARAAATAATVDGSFIAIAGMEWGVTTNGDQGHVTLLETPVLFGWETCSTCNGPSAECTPGTNCYFDVFTPKRYGYLTMYQRSIENPSSAGALGILCHPGSSEFDNYAFNAAADEALQGIAVRSGLAFSQAVDCADANVASTDYSARWKAALNKGFHLAPTGDHDSHCNNYGQALPTRTVYLLPNAASPSLTKAAILAAHKARHFYATEDPNLQLVFATGDGSHIMGDIFTVTASTTLRAAVYDPNGEVVSVLELWRGQIGAGVPSSPLATVSNQSTLSFTDTVTTGSYYYFVHGTQVDGHDFWSAPMWITYNLSGCTPPSSPVAGNNGPLCPGATLNLTATTVAGATYSWTGPAGFTSTDQNPVVSNVQPSQAGTYSVVATVAGCPSAPATTTVIVRSPTTTISGPATLCPSSVGVATTPDGGVGATYSWTVTNGQVISGQGTKTLTFGMNETGSVTLDLSVQNAEGCSSTASTVVSPDTACLPKTLYYSLTPCRVFDTRNVDGPFGGPILSAGQLRSFTVVGSCGVPPEAVSVTGNLTVTQAAADGKFRLWAGDAIPTVTEALSFSLGKTRGNNLIVRLATDGSGTVKLENVSAGTSHGILDVNGYFAAATTTGPSANQLAIRINEVDADQTSTDTAEFVELVAPAGTTLDGVLMVFHNGSAGGFAAAGYRTQSLAGQSFPVTPLSGGTKSLFVLGPSALVGFTAQPYNTLYSTGWPASNAVQNAGANEGDGLLVAYDTNANGAYDDGVDLIIDKLAYVQSGGADGGSATAAGFKSIYGSTGSTYLTIDSTTTSMGKNSNTMPAASGLTFNYTTNNANGLAPSPGALNAGQTSGM